MCRKYVFTLLLFLLPMVALAQTPQAIYQSSLSAKPSGVYEHAPWLFFVVKQPCLTEKNFAGTAESQAAENAFYTAIANEVTVRNVSFNERNIQLQEPLKSDVIKYVASQHSVISTIGHQLLFDRNSKSLTCTREYVQVAKLDQFSANSIDIPKASINKAVTALIVSTVNQQDYPLLAKYLQALDVPSLSGAYNMHSAIDSLPVNIQMKDVRSDTLPSCQAEDYCTLSSPRFSHQDIHNVVGHVLQQKGLTRIVNLSPAEELADDFFNRAHANFKKGQHPEQIINDLTLSLNLNPTQPEAWKMLSNIFRATGKPNEALSAAQQYVYQQPNHIEAWIYFYKSLVDVDSAQAAQLRTILTSLQSHFIFSPWAKKQLKG